MLEVCQTFLIVHWSTFCVHPRSIVGARIKNIVRQCPGVGLSVGNGWATLKQCCQTCITSGLQSMIFRRNEVIKNCSYKS